MHRISKARAFTLAAQWGWPAVNVLMAFVYLPMLIITWKSPEADVKAPTPRTLREAVWQPFLSFLTRRQALEILAFVVLYKFADQLAQALTRPFLIDMGYSANHRGIALATIGAGATIVGSIIGGWLTTLVGLGHSLWIFGFLQLFSNAGYFFLSRLSEPSIPAMYAATGFELLTSGMGTGAFTVLLLRLTEKRFSATQYALFSSLFALPRVIAGPITGFAVDALGWSTFFLATMVIGIPGLVMLARFVPFGVREPEFDLNEKSNIATPSFSGSLVARGLIGGVLAGAVSIAALALLDALSVMRSTPAVGFDVRAALWRVFQPSGTGDWVQVFGILACALVGGLFVAARHSVRGPATHTKHARAAGS